MSPEAVTGIVLCSWFTLSIVCLSGYFAYLEWVYYTNKNVRQLGAANLWFTPWKSVIWHLIPIFNFWLSYKALKEVWQASIDPQHWHRQRVPGYLVWWAICWGGSMLMYLLNPEAVIPVMLYVTVDVGRNLLTIKVLNQVTAL